MTDKEKVLFERVMFEYQNGINLEVRIKELEAENEELRNEIIKCKKDKLEE